MTPAQIREYDFSTYAKTTDDILLPSRITNHGDSYFPRGFRLPTDSNKAKTRLRNSTPKCLSANKTLTQRAINFLTQ